nr:MAG TPA: hypothetical protein [Microviridae sp.]
MKRLTLLLWPSPIRLIPFDSSLIVWLEVYLLMIAVWFILFITKMMILTIRTQLRILPSIWLIIRIRWLHFRKPLLLVLIPRLNQNVVAIKKRISRVKAKVKKWQNPKNRRIERSEIR